MKILVTGGAGYIGSHTCLALINEGYDIVIIDNLSNSSKESIKRIEVLANQSIIFYNADVNDRASLENIFNENAIEAVVHFAGLKSVNESINIPVDYYENNV